VDGKIGFLLMVSDDEGISRFIRDAYDTVPQIGDGRRWYDLPYKGISALSRSRLGRRLPVSWRHALNLCVNYLLPFDEHRRNVEWSRDDPARNLTVPDVEVVEIPAIWLVEFFPPSEFGRLKRSLERNS
jgi:hypothetical protein